MSTSDATRNKALLQGIFDELAEGNGRPFTDSMAEDFSWTIAGQSAWSRTWQGRQAVREQLLQPLFARFADTYTNRAQRFIAEDDHVAVQCRGQVTTTTGQRYDNSYCMVFRVEDGQLRELTEYMDTDLALKALGPP